MRTFSMLTLLLVLTSFATQAQFSIKKVLVEQHTGAWCGFCPDGAVVLEGILAQESKAIGVAIHNNDAMAIPEGDELGDFYIGGYPQATINRQGEGISRGSWGSAVRSSLSGAASVTLSFDSLGYDPVTRLVTAKVRARFTGNESGNLRMGLFIVEDSVHRVGTGYDQSNYDNTTPGHKYQGAGNPIVGFKHHNVLRRALGGAWGLPGIIPNPANFGTVVRYTFSYPLDLDWNVNKIRLVLFVSKHAGPGLTERPILNAEGIDLLANLTPATGIEDDVLLEKLNAYPNPFSSRVSFSFRLRQTEWVKAEVLDLAGRRVALLDEGIMNTGLHTLQWTGNNNAGQSAPNGMYILRVSAGGQNFSKHVLLNR